MKIEVSSGNHKIIESGTVFLYNKDSDFSLHFDNEKGFSFNLSIYFKTDDSGSQIIQREIEENNIVFKCMNFSDAGTGTTEPILLATIDNQNMYIHFWSYVEGEIEGKEKTRKVEYTVYLRE